MARKKGIAKTSTTVDKVDQYELLVPMLRALLAEMKELSKKKQDGVLNKLKVEMINRVLSQVQDLLTDEPTIAFLDLLDDDNLPTNSDAVLIFSQYESAMKQFYDKYTYYNSASHSHDWSIS